MTLAPETGEVSWVSLGLRRVPLLAEVLPALVEVPGLWSDLVALVAEAGPCKVLLAVSGRAGSGMRSGWRPRTGALPLGNLCRLGSCFHAAAGAACQRPVLSFWLRNHHRHNFLSRHARRACGRQRRVPSTPPTIRCGNCRSGTRCGSWLLKRRGLSFKSWSPRGFSSLSSVSILSPGRNRRLHNSRSALNVGIRGELRSRGRRRARRA
jgi:hypothetical protein